jgi:DNA mismatch repair ATPase MutL
MIKRPLDDNYEMAIKDIPTVIKELLMNSLDANATKILLDVNFELFEIKIKDNGTGFNTLRDIGERLVSGNSSSNADNKYGFRGRSLYAIAKVSDNIQIKTKHRNTEPNTKKITYIPQDLKMKVSDSVSGLSLSGQGSILKIVNVFNRFPIRQRCLNLKQLDTQVRTILIELSVINYRCCFQFQSSATSKLFILNKVSNINFRQLLW